MDSVANKYMHKIIFHMDDLFSLRLIVALVHIKVTAVHNKRT